MSEIAAKVGGLSGKLLVAHVVLSLDVGGLERVVLDLVHEGPELGIASVIVCIERPGQLTTEAERSGTPVFCVNKPPGLKLRTIGRLRALFEQLSPDVVHTHQIGALFYAGPAARRAGAPVVVHTEHGKKPYGGAFRKRLLGRLASRTADRFFCVSKDIADTVRALRVASAAKVQVIRNGIRTSAYRTSSESNEFKLSLGIPADAAVIGTVGRLNEVKRQDILIEAFSRLTGSFSNNHLVLVGAGPARNELEQLAKTRGVQERVHFVGYQADPAKFLHIMDVFALTSRSEGMPLSVLEAWAASVPVVVSRVGGLPELVAHESTGLVVDFGDVPALVKAFQRLLVDSALREGLCRQALSHVTTQFDVRHMAREYYDEYTRLLAAHHSAHTSASEPV